MGLSENEPFTKYLRALYREPTARVKGGNVCWPFQVGVRQGCPLSPILFSVFINDLLIGNEELGVSVAGMKEKVSGLLFADDVALLAENAENLQKLVTNTEHWAQTWEMEINPAKCGAFQTLLGEETTGLMTQSGEIPWVEEYRYLGVIFGRKNNRESRNKV
ncbi:MAG: uncharacterized protein A8A55_3229, partial [Amphiamblys sp. WSBS2006]